VSSGPLSTGAISAAVGDAVSGVMVIANVRGVIALAVAALSVIACPPGRLRQEDVLAWCRAQLAEHKVPRSVILLPTLPRNARGKVDRAALRSL